MKSENMGRYGRFILGMLVISTLFLFGCDEVRNKAHDAADSKNPALCKELKEEGDIEQCYEIVADEMNDPEVCSQSADKNGCLTEFASSKRSIKYCDMTTDAAAKYACVARVTGDNTGRALEFIIADWRSSGAVSKCKELCQPKYAACMEGCYSTLISAQEQCAGKGDDDKYWCLDVAKKENDQCKLGCYDDKDECEEGCLPKEE
jgi:hypothetical protein